MWQVMGKGRRIRRHEFLLSERAPEAPAGGEGKARKEADPERKMARCELFSYDDDHLFGARGEVSDGRASRPPLSANGQRSDSTSRAEGGGTRVVSWPAGTRLLRRDSWLSVSVGEFHSECHSTDIFLGN